MKSELENMKNPVDCDHCGGTGKVRNKPTEGESDTTQTYAHHACPVCGGTGKIPGPVVDASKRQSNCFVATVAFGDPGCPELVVLRRFRDERLSRHAAGRQAVALYYRVGPRLARIVERRPVLKRLVRRGLSRFCEYLAK